MILMAIFIVASIISSGSFGAEIQLFFLGSFGAWIQLFFSSAYMESWIYEIES